MRKYTLLIVYPFVEKSNTNVLCYKQLNHILDRILLLNNITNLWETIRYIFFTLFHVFSYYRVIIEVITKTHGFILTFRIIWNVK